MDRICPLKAYQGDVPCASSLCALWCDCLDGWWLVFFLYVSEHSEAVVAGPYVGGLLHRDYCTLLFGAFPTRVVMFSPWCG